MGWNPFEAVGEFVGNAWDGLTGTIDALPIVGSLSREVGRFGGKVADELGGALGWSDLEDMGAQWRRDPRQGFRELGGAAALAGGAYYAWPWMSSAGSAPVNPIGLSTTMPPGSEYALTGGGFGAAPETLGSLSSGSYVGAPGFSAFGGGAGLPAFIPGTDIPSLAAMSGGGGGVSALDPMNTAFAMSPSYLDAGLSALSRGWASPWGRLGMLQLGSGLYSRNRMRKLDKRLRNTDITQTPGYKAGERAIVRRASAGGYADSSRMLAELSDYGQQSYDRFAENERRNYQARMGGLMSEMNALGMISLGLGF